MFYVGKFTIILSSAIFLTLIACLAQSVDAEHLEPGDGVFRNIGEANIVTSHGSNYQTYLQVVLRNSDGQLISVTDSSGTAAYIPHQITDRVFDTLMGKKEIIIIDNVKYEKVQYVYTPSLEQRFIGLYPIFTENYDMKFETTPEAKEKMQKHKEYSMWKIHYCATFEGHGFSCVPIFQDLVSTMTLEIDDVVTHKWTILRILN